VSNRNGYRWWWIALLAIGCGGEPLDPGVGRPPDDPGAPDGPNPAVDPAGSLKLVMVDPVPGATLVAGQSYRIQATLYYTIEGVPGGRIGVLAIGAAANGSLAYLDAGIVRTLAAGSGATTVGLTVRPPATATGGQLSISFQLVLDGAESSAAQVGFGYRLGPPPDS
jgi:hypothetical protein